MRLKGRTAVVTGASRGIGFAIASAFAEQGAKVAIMSRKAEDLNEAAGKMNGEVIAIPCHVGSDEARRAAIAEVIKSFGQIDILVNNAATNPHFGPMMSIDEKAWDKTFDVNVKGYFGMTKLVVADCLKNKRKASIISVASVMGLMAAPLQGVYGMTKAAVVSMTKTLAVELGASGIRVNAIAPGLVETKFAKVLVETDSIRDTIVARTAVKRVGQPSDIAGAAVFLASDEAEYLTGQCLVIDGGWTLG